MPPIDPNRLARMRAHLVAAAATMAATAAPACERTRQHAVNEPAQPHINAPAPQPTVNAPAVRQHAVNAPNVPSGTINSPAAQADAAPQFPPPQAVDLNDPPAVVLPPPGQGAGDAAAAQAADAAAPDRVHVRTTNTPAQHPHPGRLNAPRR